LGWASVEGVNQAELQSLLTREAQQLLRELSTLEGATQTKLDVVKLVTQLRSAGHEPAIVASVLGQLQLRRRARAKFGDFTDELLYSEAGLEQATRLAVAAQHAGRFFEAGIKTVADIGCGLGADSLAFASLGVKVEAIERDLITATLATFNLAPFGELVNVTVGDAETLDYSKFEALWFDPARRELPGAGAAGASSSKAGAGGRAARLRPEDFSPNLETVFREAVRRPTGVKLSPGLDRELIPAGCEAQWVSHQGDLVELTLWFGALARPGVARSAMLINQGRTERFEHPDHSPRQAALGALGEFVYEPDAALIRSQLMGELAHQLGLTALAKDVAYLTGAEPIRSPWLRGFRVLAELPIKETELRAWVREHEIGTLEIKKRGVDITPEALRPKLKLAGSNSATLILTRLGEGRRALFCEPLSS
jgi:SAM-dependent methyltransferase